MECEPRVSYPPQGTNADASTLQLHAPEVANPHFTAASYKEGSQPHCWVAGVCTHPGVSISGSRVWPECQGFFNSFLRFSSVQLSVSTAWKVKPRTQLSEALFEDEKERSV